MKPSREAEPYSLGALSFRDPPQPAGLLPSVRVDAGGSTLPLGGTWMTPGAYLADRTWGRAEVVLVAEKIEPDRDLVIVVVDSDTEDLLDAIFAAEQEMYHRFTRFPFDVRVMTLRPGMDTRALEAESVVRYKRS